ncbi:MAG: hypothetical protein HY897_18105 [Deltaproteobacteria bacterium]|nr:hypothetical protein [Deltaproteobacteria bacterium]
MSRVEALEHEVKRLSKREFEAFREWFSEYDAADWDKQIDSDVNAGKLDELAARALSAHARGESKDL